MRNALGVLVAVTLLIVAGSAMAGADSDSITTCVNPNGLVFVVDGPDDCKSNQTPLSWSAGSTAGPSYQVVDAELTWDEADADHPLFSPNSQVVTCPSGLTALSGSFFVADRDQANPIWDGFFGLDLGHPTTTGAWEVQTVYVSAFEAGMWNNGNTFVRLVCG